VGAGAYPEPCVRGWAHPACPAISMSPTIPSFSVLVEGGVLGFGLYALLLGTLVLFI